MHTFAVGDWVAWRDDWNPAWTLKREDAVRNYGQGPFKVEDVRGETLGIRHYFGDSEDAGTVSHQTGFAAGLFKKVDPPAKSS